MRYFLVFQILFFTSGLFCQANDAMPTGVVIDTVVCQSSPQQSYALYLPANYSAEKTWPIMYAFDPVARGKMPVELLKGPAEKFGYIVVGSNNSRNGPWEPVFDSVNAISDDTRRRFSIDDKRVYTTGFSGGSRVASSVAVLTGNVAGVIGCGAGYSQTYPITPSNHFAYIGLVGRGDMNFLEMNSLGKILTVYKMQNTIHLFDGGHQWPPESVFMEAFQWLELHAIRKGLARENAAMLADHFDEKLAEARELEKTQRFFEAYKKYTELATNFAGIRDTKKVSAKVSELQARKIVRKRREFDKRLLKQEGQLRANFRRALNESDLDYYRKKGVVKKRKWWDREIKKLKANIEKAKNEDERWMFKRVLDSIWRQCAEQASVFYEVNGLEKATVYLEIWNIIHPTQSYPAYAIAAAYALAGRTENALAALNRALQNGFTNIQRLETEKAFERLRSTDEFQRLLERLKPSP